MAVTTPEVIKVNFVLVGLRLLGAPEDIESFRRASGTDVQISGAGLAANVQSGITEPQFALAMHRDRITLELSPSRSAINRDYPLREDLPRLAEVSDLALRNTSVGEQKLRAFGFNIELVFDQDPDIPAFSYLAGRLFDVSALGSEGWQFIGGAGKLIFHDGERRWTIGLEPRFGDEAESRVFLSVNLHRAENDPPIESEIRDSLEEIWDEVHNFVQRLDEG